MRKYSAVDWQAFSLRKDIEKIANHVSNHKGFQLSAFAEVMLVVFGTALSNIFSETEYIRITWIVILSVSFFLIVIPFILWGCRIIRQHKEGNNLLSAKEAIDCFDNEICYYVMMAESYLNMYRDRAIEKCSDEDFRTEVLRFYYIETSFYLNKAIMGLQPISNMAQRVFTDQEDGVIVKRKIAKVRFDNVCNMIGSLYAQIKEFEPNMDDLIINVNHRYCGILNDMIVMINNDSKMK